MRFCTTACLLTQVLSPSASRVQCWTGICGIHRAEMTGLVNNIVLSVSESGMSSPSESSKGAMGNGEGSPGLRTNGVDFERRSVQTDTVSSTNTQTLLQQVTHLPSFCSGLLLAKFKALNCNLISGSFKRNTLSKHVSYLKRLTKRYPSFSFAFLESLCLWGIFVKLTAVSCYKRTDVHASSMHTPIVTLTSFTKKLYYCCWQITCTLYCLYSVM